MRITKAEYIDEYTIMLTFDDGFKSKIDFGPFLKRANNPMNYQFLEIEKFKKFKIFHGHLSWSRHEMMFSAESLRQWNKKIVKDLV